MAFTASISKQVKLRGIQIVAMVVLAFSVTGRSAPAADRYEQQRLKMVEDYIAAEGISNPEVLKVMRTVPRHEFVPKGFKQHSYLDGALPIGHAQTISPPYIVAYMTEVIDPQPEDRVLEIGTGSGYQAAVLSGLVREVFTIEIVRPLGESAEKRLRRLGYDNVDVRIGDGYRGWSQHAPFDCIIVTCSPESVPQPLIDQLAEGGRMLIPLGQRYQQVFHLFRKVNGEFVRTELISALFVPMTGLSEDQRRVTPDPLRPSIANCSFEIDANNDGRVDNWHYQRQCKLSDRNIPDGARCIEFTNAEPGRLSQILQGAAIDGRRVRALEVRFWAGWSKLDSGEAAHEVPGLMFHFYDDARGPIDTEIIGGWTKTAPWRHLTGTIRVPLRAREMIVRVGLNGATGTLRIDDVRIKPRSR